jgi:hypothetical protein
MRVLTYVGIIIWNVHECMKHDVFKMYMMYIMFQISFEIIIKCDRLEHIILEGTVWLVISCKIKTRKNSTHISSENFQKLSRFSKMLKLN